MNQENSIPPNITQSKNHKPSRFLGCIFS